MVHSFSKKLKLAITILPFFFIIHNTEEARGMAEWSQSIPFNFHRPVTSVQFGLAVFIVSAIGLLLVFGRRLYSSEKRYIDVLSGFCGLLFLNVFFPHTVTTVILGKYCPGVYSALLLILPLTSFILYQLYRGKYITLSHIIRNSLIGRAISIPLIFILLKAGEWLT